ncbi:Uncharacterised protein [Bordetella pertussis]|nr:Uncharacterised protein [Bordetella pertussis]
MRRTARRCFSATSSYSATTSTPLAGLAACNASDRRCADALVRSASSRSISTPSASADSAATSNTRDRREMTASASTYWRASSLSASPRIGAAPWLGISSASLSASCSMNCASSWSSFR